MKSALVFILLQAVLQVEGRCRSIERNTGCPYPWRAWRDHCYLGFVLAYNFHAAETHCVGLSLPARPAHLASITSEEENEFLGEYTSALGISGFRIGYEYKAGFRWTDGSANSFTKWADGLPSVGIAQGYNCAIVYSKIWRLQWCTNPRNFVCKMARNT